MKKLMQVTFCIAVVCSSAIIFYWPDLLFIPFAVLSVGVIIFSLLTAIVPDLRWNIVVVLLFWGLFYLLGVTNCHSWPEVYVYLTKLSNLISIIVAIILHVLFQTIFFHLTRKEVTLKRQ